MAFNPAELESQRLKAAAFDTKRNQRAAHFDWKVEENYYSDISGLTTTVSPVTLFTVTGLVECKIVGVGGALTSASNTGTLAVGVTGATTLGLGTTTIDTTNFPTGGAIWIDTSPTLLGEAIVATNLTGFLTNSNIILTIATNNMLTGALRFLCAWRPWSSDGSVVSARSGG